jgi:tetrahydromethanopterin S-methyltransferase subunit G
MRIIAPEQSAKEVEKLTFARNISKKTAPEIMDLTTTETVLLINKCGHLEREIRCLTKKIDFERIISSLEKIVEKIQFPSMAVAEIEKNFILLNERYGEITSRLNELRRKKIELSNFNPSANLEEHSKRLDKIDEEIKTLEQIIQNYKKDRNLEINLMLDRLVTLKLILNANLKFGRAEKKIVYDLQLDKRMLEDIKSDIAKLRTDLILQVVSWTA